MKALIVAKEFNGLTVGTVFQVVEETPNIHLVNEGYLVAVDMPDTLTGDMAKAELSLFPEKWVKDGVEVFTQPTLPIVIDYQDVPDTSWTYVPAKEGTVATETEPATEPVPEHWVKDAETVFSQPMKSEPIMGTEPDESWEYVPAETKFKVVEDADKVAKIKQNKEELKYVRRIEYSKYIIGRMAYLNSKKTLTIEQINLLNTTYAPIKGLLETGSYPTAYKAIEAIIPDAIITAEDKTEIMAMIQNYLLGEE